MTPVRALGGIESTTLTAPAGDSLTVGLTASAGPWEARIFARIGGAEVYIGTASTTHPGALSAPSRALCTATAPGASAWRVDLSGPPGAVAMASLAPSPHPLGRPGLHLYREPT